MTSQPTPSLRHSRSFFHSYGLSRSHTEQDSDMPRPASPPKESNSAPSSLLVQKRRSTMNLRLTSTWSAPQTQHNHPGMLTRRSTLAMSCRKPPPSIVQKLPPELWKQIAAHLELEDQASLTFSCKALKRSMGTESWQEINSLHRKPEKLQFLTYLIPQLPTHILCLKCSIFHPSDNTKMPWSHDTVKSHSIVGSKFRRRQCVEHGEKAHLFDDVYLQHWMLQLALRAHHISPQHGMCLSSLSLESEKPTGAWDSCSTAAIVGGHLLVKVESCQAVQAMSNMAFRRGIVPNFPTCSHLRHPVSRALANACQDATAPLTPGHSLDDHSYRSPLYRCEWCPSEYQIELRQDALCTSRAAAKARKRDCRFMLVVSRWIDAGNALRPDNDEWFALSYDCNVLYQNTPATTPRKNASCHTRLPSSYVKHKGTIYDIGNLPNIKTRYETQTNGGACADEKVENPHPSATNSAAAH